MPQVKCRCGKSLRVKKDVGKFRCPGCKTILQWKSPASQQRSLVQSSASRATTSLPAGPVRLRCPCGAIVTVPDQQQTAKCDSCGTTLRSAERRSPGSEQRSPGRADSLMQTRTQTLREVASSTKPVQPPPGSTVGGGPPSLDKTFSLEGSDSLPKWAIPVAAALVGMLVLGGTTWLALIYFDNPTQAGRDTALAEDQSAFEQEMAQSAQPSGGTGSSGQSEMVRIGTYPPGPRLPYTREFLERDLIETLRYPIDQYVYIVPPEENAAPEYIAALARLEESLVEYLPAEEQAEARDLARQRTNLLAELTRKHQQNEAIEQRDVREFDEIFSDLYEAQQKPEFSLFVVRDLDSKPWLTEAIEQLDQISRIRIAQFVSSGDLNAAVREIRVLARMANELGSEGFAASLACTNLLRGLWGVSVPRILRSTHFDTTTIEKLLTSLSESRGDRPLADVVRAIRNEQLIILRFLYRLERTEPANRKKCAEDLIVSLQPGRPRESQEVINRIKLFHGLLAEMDDSHIQVNRKAYVDDVEGVIAGLEHSLASVVKNFPEIKRQAAQRREENAQIIRSTLAGDNTPFQPWIASLFGPAVETRTEMMMAVVTYERIIAAQAALKYVELNGDEVPRDLSRLNIFVPIPINLSDPFSGELLKTIARNRETVVYSVGPDGVDDYSIQSAETSAVSDDILLFR